MSTYNELKTLLYLHAGNLEEIREGRPLEDARYSIWDITSDLLSEVDNLKHKVVELEDKLTRVIDELHESRENS